MVEKISIQIALTGTEEIKRQLAGVSDAGKKAFDDIATAAAKAGGFDRLDPTLVARKFNQFGVTAAADVKKVTGALQAAGKTEALVTGIQRMEQGTKRLAVAANATTAAFGLTRREIGALSRAFRAIDLGPLGSQLALVGRVGGAFGPAGIAITAIGVAIVGLGAALAKFASEASETEKALTQLQKVSGASFENLSALQQVFAAGGTPAKQFAADFGNLFEKIAGAGQQAKIRNASKDTVEWANNIDNVRQQFNNLAQGVQQTFSPLTTLDTKVQAILESLAKGPTSMVPGVSDIVSAEEKFSKLADIFKNLSSDMERAQLGKALQLSPTEIATITQGSAALKQLQAEAQRLGLTLTTSNQQALQQMAQAWNEFTAMLSATFQKIGAAAAPGFGQILETFKGVMQQIVSDFQNLPLDQAIANIGSRLAPAFAQLGNVLSPILSQIGSALGDALVSGIITAVRARLGGGPSAASKQALAESGGTGFASGGWVGGSGTGTSDSNLAWVSRGEYITPARAVAQPGVLAFLEALRRSGGNLSRVLDGMGHFALGGMVSRSMPAFASGGLASGSNVTIQFPGLPAISGLRASSDVVDQLHKAAALAQVRSGGRKPSRYA